VCGLFPVYSGGLRFHNSHDDETVVSKEFPEYFHFSHTVPVIAQHQLTVELGLGLGLDA
jgi:hypothetical protein